MLRLFLTVMLVLVVPGRATAESARIAVAANFAATMERLETAFEAESGHQIETSIGATGQLFAQIVNGAPFDAFLAADQERPAALLGEAKALPGSGFTYATGRLFFQVNRAAHLGPDGMPDFSAIRRIAIANPRTAPYGAAAKEVLNRLGVNGPQIAQAQSVQGVSAVMELGAADAGFVAYSSVAPLTPLLPAGWLVPQDLHAPLHQDAILLIEGATNPAAVAFLGWLKGPVARGIIQGYGYHVD